MFGWVTPRPNDSTDAVWYCIFIHAQTVTSGVTGSSDINTDISTSMICDHLIKQVPSVCTCVQRHFSSTCNETWRVGSDLRVMRNITCQKLRNWPFSKYISCDIGQISKLNTDYDLQIYAAPLGPVLFLQPDQQSGIHCPIVWRIQLSTPNNLDSICLPDTRSDSALEVLRNCAL